MSFTVGMNSWNDRPDPETSNLPFLLRAFGVEGIR